MSSINTRGMFLDHVVTALPGGEAELGYGKDPASDLFVLDNTHPSGAGEGYAGITVFLNKRQARELLDALVDHLTT